MTFFHPVRLGSMEPLCWWNGEPQRLSCKEFEPYLQNINYVEEALGCSWSALELGDGQHRRPRWFIRLLYIIFYCYWSAVGRYLENVSTTAGMISSWGHSAEHWACSLCPSSLVQRETLCCRPDWHRQGTLHSIGFKLFPGKMHKPRWFHHSWPPNRMVYLYPVYAIESKWALLMTDCSAGCFRITGRLQYGLNWFMVFGASFSHFFS